MLNEGVAIVNAAAGIFKLQLLPELLTFTTPVGEAILAPQTGVSVIVFERVVMEGWAGLP